MVGLGVSAGIDEFLEFPIADLEAIDEERGYFDEVVADDRDQRRNRRHQHHAVRRGRRVGERDREVDALGQVPDVGVGVVAELQPGVSQRQQRGVVAFLLDAPEPDTDRHGDLLQRRLADEPPVLLPAGVGPVEHLRPVRRRVERDLRGERRLELAQHRVARRDALDFPGEIEGGRVVVGGDQRLQSRQRVLARPALLAALLQCPGEQRRHPDQCRERRDAATHWGRTFSRLDSSCDLPSANGRSAAAKLAASG